MSIGSRARFSVPSARTKFALLMFVVIGDVATWEGRIYNYRHCGNKKMCRGWIT